MSPGNCPPGNDDNRFCDDANDDIGYGFGDCATLSGVTIQLRMAWQAGGEWSVSDDALITYEYSSGRPPGGVHRTETTSSPSCFNSAKTAPEGTMVGASNATLASDKKS